MLDMLIYVAPGGKDVLDIEARKAGHKATPITGGMWLQVGSRWGSCPVLRVESMGH
jgi:hypothetical protein